MQEKTGDTRLVSRAILYSSFRYIKAVFDILIRHSGRRSHPNATFPYLGKALVRRAACSHSVILSVGRSPKSNPQGDA